MENSSTEGEDGCGVKKEGQPETLRECMEWLLHQPAEESAEGPMDNAMAVAWALLAQAKSGNVTAIREVLSWMENGKSEGREVVIVDDLQT